ncbi:50S ribosomal protein L4 [Planctomycetota bacterium]|nr:50S ribosomal protein L4 [Planctomycetota bacterium]
MATVTIYNTEGAATGSVDLDPAKLDREVRKALLKEAYIASQDAQRQGTHKTKKRSEVAGGGKKPWRQKGSGRARQGSTRSPQWGGGGHAKTVEPRDYNWDIPAGQKRLATRSALRLRLEEGALVAVDGLDAAVGTEPRTRVVAKFLTKLGLGGKGTLLVSEGHQGNLHLSTRNLAKVDVLERRNLNAGAVLRRPHLIFTKGALDALVASL